MKTFTSLLVLSSLLLASNVGASTYVQGLDGASVSGLGYQSFEPKTYGGEVGYGFGPDCGPWRPLVSPLPLLGPKLPFHPYPVY
ncbi:MULTISPECIES: hypothetical protein [unclassified Vibrio]|uniref:hypothetical protein n=1 Tax=unclassified Vibrio TaxID=2614977 RepID=UPI0012682F8B|nr:MULTISPECIES: hypothetical protein [unclassified Vibrio]QFT34853.1 hypothetical protein FIU99_00150 [Vibrio sp. THAF64]QGM32751.1 hypothetical protein GGC04_00150 [Vibrio sp. THAF191d]QGN68254.1 hypothetical protein GGC03_00150 [Vibrio sp. THAF191c]